MTVLVDLCLDVLALHNIKVTVYKKEEAAQANVKQNTKTIVDTLASNNSDTEVTDQSDPGGSESETARRIALLKNHVHNRKGGDSNESDPKIGNVVMSNCDNKSEGPSTVAEVLASESDADTADDGNIAKPDNVGGGVEGEKESVSVSTTREQSESPYFHFAVR